MKNTNKENMEELRESRNRQEAINHGLDSFSPLEHLFYILISLTVLIIVIGLLGILSYNKMQKNELALQNLYEQIQEVSTAESTEENLVDESVKTLVSDN